ncbi:hypothetical protein TNCT_391851 [Trichonephila clavata]|uniref:Uncharacterized protein n=1 Tax=Trichonephila clavata TaxID=2740835 RepID=A0A8X6G6T7_TRICU|nr:hypothetical protein TNCT_391851 [Trichonephila clavata]
MVNCLSSSSKHFTNSAFFEILSSFCKFYYHNSDEYVPRYITLPIFMPPTSSSSAPASFYRLCTVYISGLEKGSEISIS